MTVITDEKRAQVLDRINDLGVTAEIANELESMEYFYYEDIAEIYPNTSDLLNDTTNLLDVYLEAKQQAEQYNGLSVYIVSTGSVYNYDYWQAVISSELDDVAYEWLEDTPTEDLEKALNAYE